MRFFPAEPDIATIFNRIVDQDIDLQPDFQRGEVWSIKKQQRLIDSILRGWVIPPILVVSCKNGNSQQVLDGQQRLVSIRDFKLNKFPIDGGIEPTDQSIKSLHGLRYCDLPIDIGKAFDRTTLRIYEIANYLPEEPAEIFFRLNQPTTLTSAEKRNAFFGPVRDQIRELVHEFELVAKEIPVLGFSNSRMAYDDVFARLACTIELGTLRKKITAAVVNDMYRRSDPLDIHILKRLKYALNIAMDVMSEPSRLRDKSNYTPRLNKATFFSWLLFFARIDPEYVDIYKVSKFFNHFEAIRSGYFGEISDYIFDDTRIFTDALIPVYTDRATARVADVSSVLLRDFILWVCWFESGRGLNAICMDPAYNKINRHRDYYKSYPTEYFDTELLRFIDEIQWGERV